MPDTLTREQIDEAHAALDAEQHPDGAADDNVDDVAGLQGTFSGSWEEIIGGQRPTARKVRLTGGALEIAGMPQINKGQTVTLRVTCKCDETKEKDITDSKTGQVVGCNETRGLRIVGAALEHVA